MTEHVECSVSDRILELRMNRLDKKNALTYDMYAALADGLETAATDKGVRAVLLLGGSDIFTSGNDVQDFLSRPPAGEDAPVWRFLSALASLGKPAVAAVNGPAIGIGTTLLLHCDFVVAGNNARFQMPFVNIGVCPEAASSLLVPMLVGHRRAAELLLLGESFTPDQALAYGFVNRVVSAADTDETARSLARRAAQQPPNALRITKRLMKAGLHDAMVQAMKVESDAFLPLLKGPEAVEAMTAFMQKRKPDFSSFD